MLVHGALVVFALVLAQVDGYAYPACVQHRCLRVANRHPASSPQLNLAAVRDAVSQKLVSVPTLSVSLKVSGLQHALMRVTRLQFFITVMATFAVFKIYMIIAEKRNKAKLRREEEERKKDMGSAFAAFGSALASAAADLATSVIDEIASEPAKVVEKQDEVESDQSPAPLAAREVEEVEEVDEEVEEVGKEVEEEEDEEAADKTAENMGNDQVKATTKVMKTEQGVADKLPTLDFEFARNIVAEMEAQAEKAAAEAKKAASAAKTQALKKAREEAAEAKRKAQAAAKAAKTTKRTTKSKPKTKATNSWLYK